MSDREIEEVEKLPKKILIFFLVVLIMLFIGIFGFMILENASFKEGVSRTLESFAFMFKEGAGVSKFLEIFLSVFGIILLWWVIWEFSDMALHGDITEYLKISRYTSSLRKMRDHYIIAGGGRVGEEIAHDLVKVKKRFLIIEKDPVKVSKLKKKGYLVIEGDANDIESKILDKASIKEAAVLIIAMPETEKNLLLTLMAKEIKPELDIYVRCDHPEFVSRLKKAGAKAVIVPETVAAERFIQEMFGSRALC